LDVSPIISRKKVYVKNEGGLDIQEDDSTVPQNMVEIKLYSSSQCNAKMEDNINIMNANDPPITPSTRCRSREKKKIILLERWRLSLT